MRRGLVAGLLYALATYAIAFALGAFRTIVIVPLTGPLIAVLLEMPFVLTVAWLLCGPIMRRCAVPAAWPARAAMGLVALSVILLLEAALATLGFGQTLAQHVAAYAQTGPQLGLAAQVVFATFPLLRRQSRPPSQADESQ